MNTYIEEIESWRRAADENLRKENSWLALAGLYWLNEGENSFGTHPSNTIVLPGDSGPGKVGVITVEEDRVTLEVEEAVSLSVDGEYIKRVMLEPDTSGSPTEMKLGDLTLILIKREDGFGIRLWDNQRPERVNFSGRAWFPIDENYLLKGRYQPFEEDLDLMLQRKNGADFLQTAQGLIKFHLNGKDLSLIAFEQEDGSLFTLFFDQTSGKDTYPAGRYLVVPPAEEGSLEIDFNRAYNPPCAFTDYATCPLPPPQNKLEAAILAGERIATK